MNDGGDRMRWAEALAIVRLPGPDAPRRVAERLSALALAGDDAGVRRLAEIARHHERLLAGAAVGASS